MASAPPNKHTQPPSHAKTPPLRSRRLPILAAAAAAAAAVAAVILLLRYSSPEAQPARAGDDAEAAGADVAETASASANTPPQPASATPRDTRAPAAGNAPVRNDATPDRNGASLPQGFYGSVTSRDRRDRLANIAVHLIESRSNDPLRPFLRQMQAAVASAQTDAAGAFSLGLPVVQDKVYDLVAFSPNHALVRRVGLRLVADQWIDLGQLELEPGATIRGRVTVAGRSGLPVPQAVVQLLPSGSFADDALRALPRGQGLPMVHVDANGAYEMLRAPTRGVIRLAAWAPGFARLVRKDIELKPDQVTEVDFELPPGRTLSGRIQSLAGTPIANARIEARPKQRELPAASGFTDAQGLFELDGLHPMTHSVRVLAPGFARGERNGVEPGTFVELTLKRGHQVRVIARTQTGAVLRRYRLGLRRFFPKDLDAPLDRQALAQGDIGRVPEVAEIRAQLDRATDTATLVGIPHGTFVCEVQAPGFASVLSLPFRVRDPSQSGGDGRIVDVEVIVHRGAELRGRVVDADGLPLASAVVQTQRDGTLIDSPLVRVLRSNVPTRASQRSATTDADGRFAFEKLALATYQLQIEHPDACRQVVRGITCPTATPQTLRPIRMRAGSLIQGRATLDGAVTGQMKLVLTTPPDVTVERSLRMETVTDREGRYRFPRRIPPGRYVLRGAGVGQTDPGSEIIQQLLQMKRSATTVTVPPGQDIVERDIAVLTGN
ncbi:MAG: carboxypeptidase regulatory-like domain-containing protein [Planctomycetota bacterium]